MAARAPAAQPAPGTHVAGTVGGKTYGVAKEVKLFSVQGGPSCGQFAAIVCARARAVAHSAAAAWAVGGC